MGRRPTNKQSSFFKLMLDDFANHLSIPHKFTKTHIPPSLGKCVLSGPCGKRSVKLQRRNDGLFFHNHGWHCFVKDHLLQFGDFLVFGYDGNKKFKVEVYDRTCCEIEVEEHKRGNGLPTAPEKDEIVDEQETGSCRSESENGDKRRPNNYMSGKRLKTENDKEMSTRTIVFKSDYSCFKRNMTAKYSQHRMAIPKDLVVAKGLESKTSIDIEDSKGKSWHVQLASKRSARNYFYLGLSTGWVECCKANNIVLGDVVVFEFVKETVMRLHVFRKCVGTRGVDNRPISVVLVAPNIKKKS